MAAERLGTPALGVMTETFVDAAQAMAGALGDATYDFAVIPHPVSNGRRASSPGGSDPSSASRPFGDRAGEGVSASTVS